MADLVVTNARIVLADEVIHGSLQVENGVIRAIDHGSVTRAEDFEGDYLIPGLVELHTDHFENHFRPRPGVTWDALAALQAHDTQIAGAGITTVFDAVRIGSDPEAGDMSEDIAAQIGAIEVASSEDRLRAEHQVHLRCELPLPDCFAHFDAHCDRPIVKLASMMDHTPGARQFTTLEHYVKFYQQRLRLSDSEMDAYIRARQDEQARYAERNRQAVLERGRGAKLTFASHDDATVEHVDEALRDGVAITEFPTTMAAAQAAHAAGLSVLMGAPNLVRGRSHSGNVSAAELAAAGVLDVLSSDYIPLALLSAGFLLPGRVDGISLPQAIRTVTANPARAAGLDDRGEITTGLRGDLVRVRHVQGPPVVRAVWRQGTRVS